ncbi:MAG: cobalamin biosynthesis protein CobD/CbiB, partial [Thermoleophilaceae bacterium]
MSSLALVAGAAADRLIADPTHNHPVALVGRASRHVEEALWRPSRARGVAFTAVMVGVPTAVAFVVDRSLRGKPLARGAFLALLVWIAAGGRTLRRAGERMADLLEAGDVSGARELAPTLVGRDPESLDAEGLARAATESISENTADAVIGPL